MPRTALLIGWAALTLDTITQGNLLTVLMFTDLVYAAVLYEQARHGSPGALDQPAWSPWPSRWCPSRPSGSRRPC